MILQRQRARKKSPVLRRLKSFRESLMRVSGFESISVTIAEASTASKVSTAG